MLSLRTMIIISINKKVFSETQDGTVLLSSIQMYCLHVPCGALEAKDKSNKAGNLLSRW